jgi:uncharacterized protein YacL
MESLIIIALLVIAAETTYLTFSTTKKNARMLQSPVFVDTSVLIDGRIVSIAESGFISRPLYIPRSVVGELQFLADNADSEKRSRARHGLDVITQLQAITSVKALVFNDGVRAADGVDNRLLELAKKHNGAICTIDYNLNKVAVVEGLEVLNVNELAKTLRMAYLPGERSIIELSQKGNDAHQAVGHLPDGTMVVVEHAYKQIGSKVEVEFIRGLQTAAGKMMFAKLVQPATKKTTPVTSKQIPTEKLTNKASGRKPSPQRVQATTPHPRPQQRTKVHPHTPPTEQRSVRKNTTQRRRRSPEDSMVELANK